MPFLIVAEDHPDMDARREAMRQAHRAHLAAARERLLASAILAADGETIVGGASLLNVDDEVEARRFETEDAYAKAGLRAMVTILPLALAAAPRRVGRGEV